MPSLQDRINSKIQQLEDERNQIRSLSMNPTLTFTLIKIAIELLTLFSSIILNRKKKQKLIFNIKSYAQFGWKVSKILIEKLIG